MKNRTRFAIAAAAIALLTSACAGDVQAPAEQTPDLASGLASDLASDLATDAQESEDSTETDLQTTSYDYRATGLNAHINDSLPAMMTEQQADQMRNAARWCPPIDTLSSDMEALRCWLTVSDGRIEPDLKINFGDLPAWGEIDVAALAEQLAAYEAAAAEQAQIATGPSKQTSKPPTPQPRPGVQLATTYDGLHHQCHAQRIAAACNALFDLAAGGGGNTDGSDGSGATQPGGPQEPAEPVELDLEASGRLHEESLAELARLISENCPNGGSGRYFVTSGQPVEYYYTCND